MSRGSFGEMARNFLIVRARHHLLLGGWLSHGVEGNQLFIARALKLAAASHDMRVPPGKPFLRAIGAA